ncbi:protein-tyrosine phosphatase family protein [Paenibacillus alginolyticus]|uniref:Dual specificity protein phosphatase family protein n=1 Tax=Paenibacillus alginolyticus TaxID=59839 RepID=A0ABT4GJ73_9BACL|nr:dual specificity protein phosphatase family protein [Paenibacillus alginolyticus]MCY9696171.1 dual specificity protein phosphatase family protein [Paenibacillus alginolyticus]MEC0143324.1 dual specificity protein phosphatase family protein [Paenibacillus alginolyticus]
MEKNYQALVDEKIFFGGAADVEAMIKNENVEVVVDLRGETTECAYPTDGVEWLQVPLGDNAEGPQDQLFQQAINYVVEAYNSGKRVGFHCGGGKGRTGSVAIGTLIAIGKSENLEDAEKLAKSIRPVINIREPQRDALEKLFKK